MTAVTFWAMVVGMVCFVAGACFQFFTSARNLEKLETRLHRDVERLTTNFENRLEDQKKQKEAARFLLSQAVKHLPKKRFLTVMQSAVVALGGEWVEPYPDEEG